MRKKTGMKSGDFTSKGGDAVSQLLNHIAGNNKRTKAISIRAKSNKGKGKLHYISLQCLIFIKDKHPNP